MLEHPSRWALERHRLGEETLSAHLDVCESCREKLRMMEADDRAFLLTHPSPASIGVRPKPRPRHQWWPALAAFASCAAVLVMAVPPQETTRIKGNDHVELLVRRAEQTFPFTSQPLKAGDTLLFRYTSDKTYMLVAGVESSGRVALMVPSTPMRPGQNRIAPQGVQLDDFQGRERIVLLLSDHPLDAEATLRRLKAYAKAGRVEAQPTSSLQSNTEQRTWLIEKR